MRYKEIAEKTFARVPFSRFSEVFGEENNSLTVLITHISGNLKSRFTDFLTSDGEKDWRNRDREFENRSISEERLMQMWQDSWLVLFGALEALNDSDLAKTVRIRGKELTVTKALHRSLAHIAYHVGQIVFIGKHHLGANWQSLSIPKNQSAAYNRNPDKER